MLVDDDCFHGVVTATVIMSFDRMDISGKVALITGSSKRVGRETAVELARRGARVAIHYRADEPGARETLRLVQEAGGAGELFHAELTDHLAVDNMFSDLERRMGALHILVNNASVFDPGTFEQSTPELWKLQMDSNAMAPFFVAQRASRPARRSCPRGIFQPFDTPFTSHIAIIGRARMNSRNSEKKRPKTPIRIPMSNTVG